MQKLLRILPVFLLVACTQQEAVEPVSPGLDNLTVAAAQTAWQTQPSIKSNSSSRWQPVWALSEAVPTSTGGTVVHTFVGYYTNGTGYIKLLSASTNGNTRFAALGIIPDSVHRQKYGLRVPAGAFSGDLYLYDATGQFQTGVRVMPTGETYRLRLAHIAKTDPIREEGHEVEEVVIEGEMPNNGPHIVVIDLGGSGNDFDFGTGFPQEDGGIDFTPPGGGGSAPPDALEVFLAKIDDSKLGPCAKKVLDALKTLPAGNTVADIIKKFSGEDPKWNWKVEISTSQIDENAITILSNNSITTGISSAYLSTSSKLSLARTFIHESIHAYLLTYFKLNNGHVTRIEFPELWKDWEESQKPELNSIHHNEFARRYVELIASALFEFAKQENIDVDYAYCSDLAWGGLQFSKGFSALSEEERKRINNTNSIEAFGKDALGNSTNKKGGESGC